MEIITAILLIGTLVYLYWPPKHKSYGGYNAEEERKGCLVFILSIIIGILMIFL